MLSMVRAAQAAEENWLMVATFVLPVLLLGYLIWSGRRRTRQLQRVQQALTVGEQVVTTSGLFGTLARLDDQVATVVVAPSVELRFDRRAVMPLTEHDVAPSTSSTQKGGA